MPAPTWRHPTGLIRRVLEQPQRHDFFQAVHLLATWLRPHATAGHTLDSVLRFRNSIALSFPVSAIEALVVDGGRIHVTPAFIGFLGVKGVLPYCYTEAIAAQVHGERNESGRAFLDCFSQRSVLLFYRAWERCRVEYRRTADGGDGFLALQLAVAGKGVRVADDDDGGACTSRIPPRVPAYYAGLIRQRTVSAALIGAILNEYFQLPIRLEPFVPTWEKLQAEDRSVLGVSRCKLGTNFILGTRYRSRTACVRLWLGPLRRADFDHFLPDAPGGKALRAMLELFHLPALRFEVRLILRAADIKPIRLDRTARLGYGTILCNRPQTKDNGDTRYIIDIGDKRGP